MKKIFGVLILTAALFLPACGYSTRSSLPAHIKTIYVPSFPNKIDFQASNPNSYIPLLEVTAHEALVNQFLFDGNLRVVDEKSADLILKGELIAYERSPLRYTDNDNVQEYRVAVTVRLTMADPSGQILWEEPSFTGESSYFLTGPKVTSEASAVDEAVVDLAKRIVERTVEDW